MGIELGHLRFQTFPRHTTPQVQWAQAEEARTEIAWADRPQQYGMTEDYRALPIKTAMTQASKLV